MVSARTGLLLLVLVVPTRAAAAPPSDRDREGLLGPVRSVHSEEISSGETKRHPTGDLEFDDAGRRTLKTFYSDGKVFIREESSYDADGNRRSRSFQLFDPGGIPGVVGGGAPAKPVPKPADGSSHFFGVIRRDAAGRPIEETTYAGDVAAKDALDSVETFEYDARGRIVAQSAADRGSRTPRRWEYTYDADDRVAESRSYEFAYAKPEISAYTYGDVDDHGNWRERKTYAVDPTTKARTLEETEYRTITYFAVGASADCDDHPEGDVVVSVLLGGDGTVKEAHVVTGNPCPSLDAKALEASRKLAFTPAKNAAGEPVDQWVKVRVNFAKRSTTK